AGREEAGEGSGDEEAAPEEDGAAEEEPEEEKEEEPEDPPTENYADDTGFSVDLPEGWEYDRREGTSVFFDLPGGGYLQIDQTDSPGDDAERDWRQQEGAISQNFSGYRRQHIKALEDPWTERYVSAADWEFTFDHRHAVNRAFHTEDKGYALFLVSPTDTWEENRALLDDVAASFEPASCPGPRTALRGRPPLGSGEGPAGRDGTGPGGEEPRAAPRPAGRPCG